HNKRRLLILLGIAVVVLFFYNARDIVEGFGAFLANSPTLLIQLIILMVINIGGLVGLMWFLSRPRTYTVTPDDPQIGLSFDDYRGQPDLVDHAKTLVRILGGVERFKMAGGEMPKGMLLSGQPGTGKTFLAGVIAAEAKLPFIYIDASSLRSMWMGVDALIIISLFRKGRGPVPPKPLVFVMGATNRPDVLDSALTRPGRLDRSLIVYPPDGEGRKDIIQHYLSRKAHDETCNVDMMAQDSIGWTPIHIKTI